MLSQSGCLVSSPFYLYPLSCFLIENDQFFVFYNLVKSDGKYSMSATCLTAAHVPKAFMTKISDIFHLLKLCRHDCNWLPHTNFKSLMLIVFGIQQKGKEKNKKKLPESKFDPTCMLQNCHYLLKCNLKSYINFCYGGDFATVCRSKDLLNSAHLMPYMAG